MLAPHVHKENAKNYDGRWEMKREGEEEGKKEDSLSNEGVVRGVGEKLAACEQAECSSIVKKCAEYNKIGKSTSANNYQE